eukprot:1858320-Karenia_brevis.AAC.1
MACAPLPPSGTSTTWEPENSKHAGTCTGGDPLSATPVCAHGSAVVTKRFARAGATPVLIDGPAVSLKDFNSEHFATAGGHSPVLFGSACGSDASPVLFGSACESATAGHASPAPDFHAILSAHAAALA